MAAFVVVVAVPLGVVALVLVGLVTIVLVEV